MTSRRSVFHRNSVSTSSSSIKVLKPATSAKAIAISLRLTGASAGEALTVTEISKQFDVSMRRWHISAGVDDAGTSATGFYRNPTKTIRLTVL
jgi:hypothetical protein